MRWTRRLLPAPAAPRALLGLALAAHGAPAAAQALRPSDLVAAFESTAARPILAAPGQPQAYGGLALGGIATLGEGFALPVGGGVGLGPRTELGVDLALGLSPWDPLDRARVYGRQGLVPHHLAVQLGAWLPTAPGEPLGLELMLPARWEGDTWQLYAQARALLVPASQTALAGLGSSVVRRVAGPVHGGLDLGVAARRVATDAPTTATSLLGAPLLGVQLGRATVLRARLAFPQLVHRAPTGGPVLDLQARSVELVAVHRIGA